MRTIKQVRNEMDEVDAKITAQRKRGSLRDKTIVRELQTKHYDLTKELARLFEADGFTPKDIKDSSGEEYVKEQEAKAEAVKKEIAAKAEPPKEQPESKDKPTLPAE